MASPHATKTATMPVTPSEMRERFLRLFGGTSEVRVFQAPGRVNLIGEHTDYNEGFVFPAALGFATKIAVRARDDRTVRVYSGNFDETHTFSLDKNPPVPSTHWSDYVRGVAGELTRAGIPPVGADLYIVGEVPVGSGLSSSAAIEVSTALSLLAAACLTLEPKKIALLCQAAEHHYVGTKCGIMDQLISCVGQHGHAMVIDCRNLTWEPAPIPDDVSIVICDTMVKHELASGEYNRRRAECEQAVKILRKKYPSVRALRDADISQLESVRPDMSDVIYRRALHVISEDQRVLDAAAALKTSDLARFGELMQESHRSLRDNYEVSCRELDLIVSIAMQVEGVFGARMTGGGFGGCAVALAPNNVVEQLATTVRREYRAQTGIDPAIYIAKPEDGAREIG